MPRDQASPILSREARIVFLTAAGHSADGELREFLREAPNWERMLTLAISHKAAASVCRAFERMPGLQVPEEIMNLLRQHKMISEFHLLHLREKLVRTTRALGQRDVPVMLLKGAALGASLYPSFVERPMADIDLLIHTRDVTAAREALAESGWTAVKHPSRDPFYAEHHHLAPFKDSMGSGHSIELHIRAFPPPNPFGEVASEMWRDAVVTGDDFSGALSPSRTHMLVYACVHFAWSHRMGSGTWRTIRDIAELSGSSPDWTNVVETARRWRASSSCYWTLRLAETLSGVRVPSEVLSELRPPVNSVVANALERHAITCAVPGERPACPSKWVNELMWRGAIRPRWSGHINGRPSEHIWPTVQSGSNVRVEANRSVTNQLLRLGEWWRYLGSVLSARTSLYSR